MKADAMMALRTVFPFVVTCVILYLIGSFISVSFDPSDWTFECRMVTSIASFAFGFALLMRIEHGRN